MNGRVALVTGASRGIGAAMATLLRERGAEVLVPTRHEMDLASRSSIASYCASIGKPVDILVNNAGINIIAGVGEVIDETWDEMVQVDLNAPFELARRLVPGMVARKWGRILNVSSVFSLVTRERRIAYSTVKSGLNGMTRALALELAGRALMPAFGWLCFSTLFILLGVRLGWRIAALTTVRPIRP